jgi:hypothetical protein
MPRSGVGDRLSKPKSTDNRREFLALDIGRLLSTMLFRLDSINIVAAWSNDTRGPPSLLHAVSMCTRPSEWHDVPARRDNRASTCGAWHHPLRTPRRLLQRHQLLRVALEVVERFAGQQRETLRRLEVPEAAGGIHDCRWSDRTRVVDLSRASVSSHVLAILRIQ